MFHEFSQREIFQVELILPKASYLLEFMEMLKLVMDLQQNFFEIGYMEKE